MNILITSPSFNTKKNVSGISSVAQGIVNNINIRFIHLIVGKEDSKKRNLTWALAQLKLPLTMIYKLITIRINLIHINAPLDTLAIFRDFVLLCISKLFNIKIILHFHGGAYLLKSPKSKLFKRFLIFYFSKADHVIVLSDFEKIIISKNYLISYDHISTLENCVNFHNYSLKNDDSNIVRIIFLGRIVNTKGIVDIINAVKMLNKQRKDFEFYLYGIGPEKDMVVKELKYILGDRFSYKGIVSGENKDIAFLNSHIFLLPSISGEGLPIALLEAMNFGNIVIVTNDGSMGTVVINGYNGFIVEKKDPSGLFNKLNNIIDLIKVGKANNISLNAVNTIKNKYNCIEYYEKLKSIYLKQASE